MKYSTTTWRKWQNERQYCNNMNNVNIKILIHSWLVQQVALDVQSRLVKLHKPAILTVYLLKVYTRYTPRIYCIYVFLTIFRMSNSKSVQLKIIPVQKGWRSMQSCRDTCVFFFYCYYFLFLLLDRNDEYYNNVGNCNRSFTLLFPYIFLFANYKILLYVNKYNTKVQ